MALTILYRHSDRPAEAGMTMISAQAKVAAMAAELEKRGFVVDKITAWSGQPRPQVPVRKLPPSALALRRSRDTVDLP
jgi:hypothetical protein